MARPRKAATTPDYRAKLATLMKATLADEAAHGDWTYLAVRPCGMPTATRKWTAGTAVRGDCSKGVQFLCWWTPGINDPMGEDYGAYGNSQTLWSHLQHLGDKIELLVGDFVTFGVSGEQHAAMVLEAAAKANGYDPLLWSFGHPGTPNAYRLSEDRRPQQYLRNPLPTYVPTPLEQARARTGWFAWVAWRLGEGDYKEWGPASQTARPNVPRTIPPSWWTRYAAFLLRRKRGTPSSAATPTG